MGLGRQHAQSHQNGQSSWSTSSFCPDNILQGPHGEREGVSLDARSRVARRTTNDYGKSALERAMILDDLAVIEPLLREGCTHELDASRPLDEIVADLIAIASHPMTTS